MRHPATPATEGWLARRLKVDRPLVLQGAFDPLSARMIERFGAEALYCSGFAACAAGFGLADLGLATGTEMADHFLRIRAVTTLPMIVDADTGYGGVGNVERTITTLAAIGVSACHVEDQTFPKRCGHMAGKDVVGRAEAIERLEAAIETGRSRGVEIIARTDALGVHGVGEAIARANLFLGMGAVAAFVDGPGSQENLDLIAREVHGPLVFNTTPEGWGPALVPASDAYRIIIRPLQLLLAAFEAVHDRLDPRSRTARYGQRPIDRLQQILMTEDTPDEPEVKS